MTTYILKRILIAVPVLLGISIIAFVLVRMVPGDPVRAMLGMHYTEAQAERLRAKYALDRPMAAQYFIWLGHVARGDFGRTIADRPVLGEIVQRLPVTLQLAGIGILFAAFVGIPLGIVAAIRGHSTAGYAASTAGLLGISIPGFWLGTILILFFSIWAGWFPSQGYVSPWRDLWENLRHMVLPGLALGTAVAAVVMRMTRSTFLEVIGQDYIRTARAKGLAERVVILRHALKNAMIPIVTVVGLQAGYLLGGSVVIEFVFALPGVGRLVWEATQDRDYALLQGAVLFIACAFVLINLLVDVLYAALDPRIRYG